MESVLFRSFLLSEQNARFLDERKIWWLIPNIIARVFRHFFVHVLSFQHL